MSLLDQHVGYTLAAGGRVPMSEADFLALDGACAEWVNGEAIIMSPVSIGHGRLTVWLTRFAGELAERGGLGEVFTEPVVCRIGVGKLRSPDVMFVSKGREDIVQPHVVEGAPDLVIEVVSPDSRGRDYHEKFLEYQAAGVREYWIFDPLYERVDLHRLSGGAFVEVTGDELMSAVLEGFRFRPQWLGGGKLPMVSQVLEMGKNE